MQLQGGQQEEQVGQEEAEQREQEGGGQEGAGKRQRQIKRRTEREISQGYKGKKACSSSDSVLLLGLL